MGPSIIASTGKWVQCDVKNFMDNLTKSKQKVYIYSVINIRPSN